MLEETQAELMKAIPDLDFAATQIKPSSNAPSAQPSSQGGTGTPEHRVSKPQHKLSGKEGGSRRGSGEKSEMSHNRTSLSRGNSSFKELGKSCFVLRAHFLNDMPRGSSDSPQENVPITVKSSTEERQICEVRSQVSRRSFLFLS